MILACHLLVGAAIATKIPNLAWVLILAFLSHYLLDLIIHRDYSIENIKAKQWQKSFLEFLKVGIDLSFGILLIFLFSQNQPIIYAAAFLAVLSDGFTMLFLILPRNKLLQAHHIFHQKINSFAENKKIPAFWGIISQVVVISIAISFLL